MYSIDYEKVCRVCLQDDTELESIFNHTDKVKGLTQDLSLKMNFCSDTIVSMDDGLPNKICHECVQLLNKAYTYKTLCAESDKKLRSVQIINTEKNCIATEVIKKYSKFKLKSRKRCTKSSHCASEVYQCDTCSKIFTTKSRLIQHIVIHNNSKVFICEICGRAFNRRDYLSAHLFIHTGEKKHACTKCDYRASQRSSLVVHERTHSGIRPYTCEVCGWTCISGSRLVEHRRQHNGIKSYQCELCSKCYSYKTSLEEHITATHNGLKKFLCSTCNISYSRKRNLTRHIKQKHQFPLNLSNETKT